MSMEMKVEFTGGKRVDVSWGDLVVKTDQSVKAGGDGSAPEPYAYFLASLGACAGIYVLGFCESRSIPVQGISLTQKMEWEEKGGLKTIGLDIHVPKDFPEKYRSALVRVADQCAVKRTILNPPEFKIETVVDE